MIFAKYRALFREDPGFTFLVLAILFVPIAFSHFTYEKFETVKLTLLAVFAGLSLAFGGRPKRGSRNFKQLVLMFLGAAVIATIFSVDRGYSLLGRTSIWFGLFLFLSWSVFAIRLNETLNADRLKLLLDILLITAFVNSVLSWLQAFSIGYYENAYSIGELIRPPGLMGNPNYTAMFVASLVPAGIYFLGTRRNFWAQVYYGVIVFTMVMATVILSSRGAILGLLAGLGLMFLISLRINYRAAIYSAAAAALALAFYIPLGQPFRTVNQTVAATSEKNISFRLDLWHESLDVFKSNFLTGIGFGNRIDSHNIFLTFAASGGILLLGAFIALVVFVLKRAWPDFKNRSLLNASVLAMLAAFLVGGSFNPISISCMLLLGLLLPALVIRDTEAPSRLLLPSRRILGACLIMLGLVFISSESLFYYGLKELSFHQNYNSKALRAAAQINPSNDLTQAALIKSALGRKDVNEANALIREYIDTHPKNSYVRMGAGEFYFELAQQTGSRDYFEKSVSELKAAIELEPSLTQPRYQLALEYYSKNGLAISEDYANQVLAIDDMDINSWLLLTNIHLRNNQRDQAIVTLEKAYEVDIKNKTFKHALDRLKKGAPMETIVVPVNVQEPDQSLTLPKQLL